MADVPVPPLPGARPARPDFPSARTVLRTVWIVVLVVLALYLIYLLRKPIGWLVVACFLAIALSAPINLLSRWMKRGFAVVLVYLGLLLIPVLIGLLIVPPIVREANQLADDLPGYVSDVRDFTKKDKTLQRLESDYGITTKLQKEAQKLPDKLGGAAGTLGDIGLSLVNSLFAALNILILSIFMVGGGPAVAGVDHPPATSRAPAAPAADPRPGPPRRRELRRRGAAAGDDRRGHDLLRPDHPGRAVRGAAGGRDLPLRPHPARRRDRGRGGRRARHRLQRLPDHDDHLGRSGRSSTSRSRTTSSSRGSRARRSTSRASSSSSRSSSGRRCSGSRGRCSRSPSRRPSRSCWPSGSSTAAELRAEAVAASTHTPV